MLSCYHCFLTHTSHRCQNTRQPTHTRLLHHHRPTLLSTIYFQFPSQSEARVFGVDTLFANINMAKLNTQSGVSTATTRTGELGRFSCRRVGSEHLSFRFNFAFSTQPDDDDFPFSSFSAEGDFHFPLLSLQNGKNFFAVITFWCFASDMSWITRNGREISCFSLRKCFKLWKKWAEENVRCLDDEGGKLEMEFEWLWRGEKRERKKFHRSAVENCVEV